MKTEFVKCTLKDIAARGKGSVISGPFGSNIGRRFFQSAGIPVIRGNNLSNGVRKFIDEGFVFVSREKADQLNAYAMKDDLIFTAAGTIGQVGIIEESAKYDKYVISNKQLRARLDAEKANPLYAYYWFSSPWMIKDIVNKNTGSTVPLINLGILKRLKIHLPAERATQDKVAAVLSALDAKLELNERATAELEAAAKSLFEYWFVQFDFPNKERKPYKSSGGRMIWSKELKREIPIEWQSYRLSRIVRRIATGLNPRRNFVLGTGNNYYVTIKNIDYGRVVIDDKCDRINDEALLQIDSRSDLQIGDVLFTSIEPVGKTYLLQCKPQDWNINESVFTIRPDYDFVTSEYLYLLLSSDEIRSFTRKSSAGSTFKGIRIGVLNTFLLAYPDRHLICEFSDIVKPLLKTIRHLEIETQSLTTLRAWLLPMLMNGQVRVAR